MLHFFLHSSTASFAFKEWLKQARTMKTAELWEAAKAKLRGHYAYYGVTARHQEIRRGSRKTPDEMAEQTRQKTFSHLG